MALGIIMIIIGIPFLLVWGITSIGIFIPDPSGASISMGSLWGSWIIVSLFTFLPGFLLVHFGVKQIKLHNRKIQAQKDWYAHQNELHNERQQQHQNHSSGSIHTIDHEDMQHIPHRQPNPNLNSTTSYSSTTTTSNMNGNSTTTTDYKIFNPLDPKTAPYTSWQQQQRNQQTSASQTQSPTPSLKPKKVDCSGCGAIYTIAPHETKDCEYCGNTVVYE